MKTNMKSICRMVAVLASVACLSAPAFADDSSTSTDAPPTSSGQDGHHHGKHGRHHHGGGLFMICVGQNLPAGTALPSWTKGQEQANKTAMQAFFTGDAFKIAAGKCTQYKPQWHKKGQQTQPSSTAGQSS